MAIVKIPSRSRVMAFSNNCPFSFCSHGKGDFQLAAVILGQWGAINATVHEQTIAGEEMHPLASNVVDDLLL